MAHPVEGNNHQPSRSKTHLGFQGLGGNVSPSLSQPGKPAQNRRSIVDDLEDKRKRMIQHKYGGSSQQHLRVNIDVKCI